MIPFAEVLFWTTSFLVVYPYTIYPLLLGLLSRLNPRKTTASPIIARLPHVTLVISAFNEQAIIANKLENCLALDFPPDHLDVIVASDASSDQTDEIVRDFAKVNGRVLLVRQDERRGKSAILNKAVAAATGEIVVFSDANAMYEADAVSRLVDGFADPKVGYVVGAALYYDAAGLPSGESEGLYWNFELLLKRLESAVHSVVGGDGAIYAVRKHLFSDLRDDDISDFVNPLRVIAAGYRGLFVPTARCFEHAGETFAKEFARKRRIVNRGWRAVCRYGPSLNTRQNAKFVFMLASHKVIRWFALPMIILAWLANITLLGESPLYAWTWSAISVSIMLAVCGAILDRFQLRQHRVVSVFHYFYAINLAGMLGIWDEWRGVHHVTWDHIRKVDS